jgi:Flp pilus assembly protein TadB
VLTYALNPTYASVLLEGTGLYLLIAAGVMTLMGLLLIRKITSVRV